MGKKGNWKLRVLLCLLLVLAAALVFLWPFSPRKATESPAPAETSVSEAAAAERPAAQTAAPAVLAETPAALPTPVPEPTLPPTPSPEDEDAEKIRVSELMVKNRATLPDEDGDFPDWLELENISEDTVDLGGWMLRDSEKKPFWIFPELQLEPGERTLLFLSGKGLPGHADFSLSEGETLQILTDLGAPAAELCIPAGEADVAWIPTGDGGWESSLYPTPGLPNTSESYDALMEQRECESPLVINEVCTYNKTSRWTYMVGISDWVELQNVSDEDVSLADYYLSDDVDQRLLWQLPDLVLEPGGYFLILCNDEGSLLGAAPLCDAFSLSSTADRVYLSSADGSLADYVSLRDIPYEGSFGRLPGENGWFFLPQPSPGSENFGGARRVAAAPTALEADGVFNGVEEITVTLEGRGEIRYTTDGGYPDEFSELYEEPITLTETGVVRAICLEEGALPSRALTLNYFINEGFSLPVVSLLGNNPQLYQIYTSSTKDMEVAATVSFYEEGGSFTFPCGVKMHGESSLILPKKNMSLRFRGTYGLEELHYDLFGDGGVCDFTNLLLRAGQDYYHAIIRNELCTELARAASDRIVTSRSRYCILYLDGKYMGIYALEEKLNEAMYAHLLGVSKGSVTVNTAPLEPRDPMYQEVISFAEQNDLSLPENYEELCRRFDVASFIDWLILEGCFGNDDLTYSNVRYCRSTEGDGKWHLMFYDLDSCFYATDNCFSNLFAPWNLQSRQVCQLAGALLQNQDFRASLLSRAGELIPTALSNERILEEIDRLSAVIDPEVARDYQFYEMFKENWEWNVDWLRNLIRESNWEQACIDQLCSYLQATAEERALYFPGR